MTNTDDPIVDYAQGDNNGASGGNWEARSKGLPPIVATGPSAEEVARRFEIGREMQRKGEELDANPAASS